MATTIEELQVLITAKTSGLQKAMVRVKERMLSTKKATDQVTQAISNQTRQAVDTSAKMKNLSAILENTNHRIELQKKKLEELKAESNNLTEVAVAEMSALEKKSYEVEGQIRDLTARLNELKEEQRNAVSSFHADLIGEEIKEVESSLTDLTAQADKTGQQMIELQEKMDRAGDNKLAEKIANTEARILALTKSAQRTQDQMERLRGSTDGVNKTMDSARKQIDRVTKSTKSMGNQFTRAFKRIARQVLIFAVIYKAIRGLQDYIGSSLRTNDEYAKSLVQIRMNMKAAFAPIFQAALPAINALIKAMVTATTYVAAFTSALFGKTYKQSLEAAKGLDKARAAMDKTGKSANKLSGFDELNLLDTSTGGDDGGFMSDLQAFELPELDIDRIQSQMDALVLGIRTGFDRAFSYIRTGWQSVTAAFAPGLTRAWAIMQPELAKWKEQFGLMFNDIVSLGEPLKNWWQNDLMPLWEQSIAGVATIYSGLSESVREVFASIWDAAFPIIDQFVTDGLPRITEFAQEVENIFMDMFGVVKQIFDDIWQDVIDPVMQLISQIVQDALDILFGWWDTWGKKIVDNIRETLNRIKELWDNLWHKFLKPIVTSMLNTMKRLWDDHLKGLLKEIGNFIGKLVTAAQDIFNKFIMPIVSWLVDLLGPAFAEVFDLAATIVLTALGTIIDVASGIIKAIGGIIDFITGVFTGDWERAWDGIKQIFSGIGDAIGSIFKGAINVIIDTFNFLIRQLNKIRIDMPGWVQDLTGWKGFGINIPEIPRLDVGTNYVPRDMLAVIHKGEAVVPKKYNPAAGGDMGMSSEALSILRDILHAIRQNRIAEVVLSEREVTRTVIRGINHEARRTGRNPLLV